MLSELAILEKVYELILSDSKGSDPFNFFKRVRPFQGDLDFDI